MLRLVYLWSYTSAPGGVPSLHGYRNVAKIGGIKDKTALTKVEAPQWIKFKKKTLIL